MLRDLLIAIGGMIVLIGIWIVTQIVVRSQSPEPPEDGDVLACGACNDSGICGCGATSRTQADQDTRSRSIKEAASDAGVDDGATGEPYEVS